MKIAIVGGIYGMPPEFRRVNLQETVETLLEHGLRARGHEVTTYGHHDLIGRHHDVVHVHHLGRACIQMVARRQLPFAFSRHATKDLPRHQRAVLAATYRRADAVVAASDFERGELETRGVPADKLVRIYNGTSTVNFVPALRSRPTEGRPWRLLTVGQLIELKRTHLAIELVAHLARQGTPVHLDLVYQRDTLEGELRDLTRSLSVEELVTFHGPLDREQLGQLVTRAHVLVHPSRTEALPTVATEAALAALPILCFGVGGVREQVADQSLVLERDRTELLLPTMGRVMADYEEIARASLAHAATAKTQFDVELMVTAHERVYDDIVGSQG